MEMTKTKGVEAMGLLLRVNSFKCLLFLIVFGQGTNLYKRTIRSPSKPLIRSEQASNLVLGTISSAKALDHIFDYARLVATHLTSMLPHTPVNVSLLAN